MNKKTGKSLLFASGLLLAASGLAFHAETERKWVNASGAVTLCLETPLCAKDSQALCGVEEGQMFTAWGELADVEISDPDLGNEIRTDILLLDGSSEQIFPSAPVLPQGDTYGCLIGEKSAWELFGSTQVTGEKIRIGNEERMIRGVVNLPESGVVLGGSVKGLAGAETDAEEAGRYYDRITVGSGKAEDAEAFLVRNGLDGKVLRLDYLRSLRWFAELIPGKWSDFPGWKENFAGARQNLLLLLQIDKNSIELAYMRHCSLYMRDTAAEAVCVAGMLACFLRFGKNMQKYKRMEEA